MCTSTQRRETSPRSRGTRPMSSSGPNPAGISRARRHSSCPVVNAPSRDPGSTAPEAAASKGGRFVVQRHRARRLHYDFRLEIEGVLASWAVPKGPTLAAGVRRQAIHVEDHPIEYYEFEGVIPKGEYGGGDVIVWDWGHWTPAKPGDPEKSIAKGEIHFDLVGEKLRGRFVLVRSERGGERSKQEQW